MGLVCVLFAVCEVFSSAAFINLSVYQSFELFLCALDLAPSDFTYTRSLKATKDFLL